MTVIIPAYNASDYISETIQSIVNQTYANLEIIVVDDGSTDDTKEIVTSFRSKVKYIYQENSGSCASPRNTGLRHARGEYVTFFDADDVMMKDKIQSQVADLNKNSNAVISISNYWNFTETERFNDHFSSCSILQKKIIGHDNETFQLNSKECRRILLEENFAIASSPLFRTSVVKAIGGFDEALKACEDFHLIYRVAMQAPIIINPNTGFYRRLHDTNMSSDNERMLKYLIQSRDSLNKKESIPELRHRLQTRVREYKRALQSCLLRKGDTKSYLQLYFETFPPGSWREAKHDLKNIITIFLTKIGLRV
ncbi:glycosyltransferase family A protein [Marinobacter sp. MIT932201]|uniref:glycosyltransferase family A protein n=1 Tax=Marinobacter sp. MIT932201 TaxID=3096995 RepID=UPI0039999EA0